MARITIGFGTLLVLLGIGAYAYALSGEEASVTALIPAFIGLPILFLGLASLKWNGRSNTFSYIAIGLAVLGFLGSARGLTQLPALISSPDDVARPAAVVVQSIMVVLCLLYAVAAFWTMAKGRRAAAPPQPEGHSGSQAG